MSEEKILAYIAQATQSFGKDYVAVSHAVRQTSTGREGEEILLLLGIAANTLTDEQCKTLKKQLRDMIWKN